MLTEDENAPSKQIGALLEEGCNGASHYLLQIQMLCQIVWLRSMHLHHDLS